MPKNFLKILFYILPVIIMSSCISSRKVNYMQKPDLFIPAYKDSLNFEDYKLRKGDRLYVKVYSTNEKTNSLFNGGNNMRTTATTTTRGGSTDELYTYLIEEDGTVVFPMVGEILLEGLTVREATTALEKAIEPLFRFSTVEIKIAERYFSIIGNSGNGLIQIPKEKINIFQALAMAGDIGLYGDKSKIRILRETANGTVIKTFDVRSADIINSEYFYVEPNDVIYVQNLDEQFFSVTNLPSLFSTIVSTFSFGVFIYNLFVPASTQ